MAPYSPFDLSGAPEVLPRGAHGLDREVVLASQRGRLLSAFVAEAAEKGFHAVTISDIVGRAGTAKRTFYEHFEDKDDCYRQAFQVGSSSLIAEIVKAGDEASDPIERIEVGVRTYLHWLVTMPDFARLFLSTAGSDGPGIVDEWINWIELLAGGLVAWRAESRLTHPEVPELTTLQAVGALSAVNEVARIALVRGGIEEVRERSEDIVRLAIGLLTAELPPAK